MGAATKNYLMTETAGKDFRQARQWSRRRWGAEQTRKYFQDLHDGANGLARDWRSKPERKHLTGKLNLKIHPVREHYLVYVPWDGEEADIVLVALIRQNRNVPEILKANDFLIRRQLRTLRDFT